jgi:hypothetical protein
MLFYCAYTWHPHTSGPTAGERLRHQHEAGLHAGLIEGLRGWYSFAGGGAGFFLVETDDARQLSQWLQPYTDLMSWDVRAIHELDLNQVMANVGTWVAPAARQAPPPHA